MIVDWVRRRLGMGFPRFKDLVDSHSVTFSANRNYLATVLRLRRSIPHHVSEQVNPGATKQNAGSRAIRFCV